MHTNTRKGITNVQTTTGVGYLGESEFVNKQAADAFHKKNNIEYPHNNFDFRRDYGMIVSNNDISHVIAVKV